MSDQHRSQTQPYPNGASGYDISTHESDCNTTPLVSPTASIAFSDSIHMSQQFGMPQYDIYASQNLIASHPREWYTEYSSDRHNSVNQVLQNAHQAVYSHGTSLAETAYAPSTHIADSIAHWQASSHQQLSPTNIQQMAPWQPLPHQQFEGMVPSRHNSIASTSVTTAMSTAPTTTDDQSENIPGNAIHTKHLPLSPHQQSHQLYHGTRVAIDQNTTRNATECVSNGVRSDIQSPISISTESNGSSSQIHSASPKETDTSYVVTPSSTSTTRTQDSPVKRKRGRPRLIRDPEDANKRSRPDKPSRRQPHNEIERKYREGLNAEMEKLRDAIPHLPQVAAGPNQKPSKASVLKNAVEEIESLRAENAQAIADKEKAELELERALKVIRKLKGQVTV